jgi:hypothetical protein
MRGRRRVEGARMQFGGSHLHMSLNEALFACVTSAADKEFRPQYAECSKQIAKNYLVAWKIRP